MTATILPFPTAPEEGIIDCLQAAADSGERRMLYDRREAARQLSISVRSLDYLIAGKKLATRRVGKKVLIPHAELVRFARADHFDGVAA